MVVRLGIKFNYEVNYETIQSKHPCKTHGKNKNKAIIQLTLEESFAS